MVQARCTGGSASDVPASRAEEPRRALGLKINFYIDKRSFLFEKLHPHFPVGKGELTGSVEALLLTP